MLLRGDETVSQDVQLHLLSYREEGQKVRGLRGELLFQCAVGPSGRTRVDVELVLVLKRFKLVRVAGDEDVDVELPLQQRQAGHVAPRDHLVAVDEANLELAHRHHLLLRVVEVLRGKRR